MLNLLEYTSTLYSGYFEKKLFIDTYLVTCVHYSVFTATYILPKSTSLYQISTAFIESLKLNIWKMYIMCCDAMFLFRSPRIYRIPWYQCYVPRLSYNGNWLYVCFV